MVEGKPLVLTSVHRGTVLSSLRVPLGAVTPAWAEGFVTLFAARPDAFVSLAGDVAAALHVPHRRFRLDENLEQNLTSEVTGLGEISANNQAIGVLIDRGHFVPTAQGRLQRQATVTDLTAYRNAHNLISNF